ncbi:MAG: heavy metal translocating P-type ATPase [Ignavibacteriales bacterium]|jgi:Cd2+/Zn2+-exporting ATPase|nr:heavy metal translocating P-type ATPase [Ignavibacteriaceae bacterium]MEB2354150.1 heavy metal translocating P-type ATPase [Ignavibacteriales bacterium]GIK23043.1 MAG: heavy metal translocating P-type ATPase [Ignavibacteriota bacterium]
MKKYKLNNIDCASCANNIEKALSQMPEVRFVSINFAASTLHVDTDNIQKIKSKIKEIEPEVDIIDDTDNIISKNELLENKKTLFKAVSALILLIIGVLISDQFHNSNLKYVEYTVFIAAYFISGWNVITGAIKNIFRGKVFDEQFLMTIATIGAFAINQLPEAVAVMLFYVVGEFFQDIAVNRSRRSVKALLEIRPDYANLKVNDEVRKVTPMEVHPGQIIIVKPGEKIPLDGIIIEGSSFVDTSALTGEFVPRSVKTDESVLAGMINKEALLTIKVTKEFGESSISKILEMVENSGSKKAETEKFITTFAKYYTPIVVLSAVLIAVLPPLIFTDQSFDQWIYRALVVLVISCPCALVISIPLGYFGGIGGASRKGILIKGSNYLDALTEVKTVVYDKTGTLTKGEFKVAEVFPYNGFDESEVLKYAAYAEVNSNHPIAKSIIEAYKGNIEQTEITETKEISGHGITAKVSGKNILIGNDRLLHFENIEHDKCDVEGTVVHVAVDKKYAGYILISDTLKNEATKSIELLNKKNINTVMLTGDNKTAAEVIAKKIGIKEFYFELLPENKVEHIEQIISQTPDGKVAFVGDGINDAPVLARADIGIAMGALGSDAAVETADIVLMSDSPMQVVHAIDIAKRTRRIVWQNISFALGVKSVFIILGVFGIATMWEAVFGDVGVAIAAILNSMRVMNIDLTKE